MNRTTEVSLSKYRYLLDIYIDLRSSIRRDSQWNREIYLREALEDLRSQLDLKQYDEIIFYGTHSKHFNKTGSYFQILRRFFVLEENCSFNLNLRIGRKYSEFATLKKQHSNGSGCFNADSHIDNVMENWSPPKEDFEISQKDRNLMKERLRLKG